jgi:hypothetical protein
VPYRSTVHALVRQAQGLRHEAVALREQAITLRILLTIRRAELACERVEARVLQKYLRRPAPVQGVPALFSGRPLAYPPPMAAILSARKLQLEILGSAAADYRHCFLTVDCGGAGCERGRTYPVSGIAGVFPGLTMGEVLSRMRCHGCGEALTSARLQTAAPGQKYSRSVELVGYAAQGPRRD